MKSKFTLGAPALRRSVGIIEDVMGIQEINGSVYLRCGDRDTKWYPESEFEPVKTRR